MDKIAVLIPCYNEEQTIAEVVSDFKQVLPSACIYVYDNNSTDRTAEEALSAGALVHYEPRQGKGNVIRSMFRQIDADCYLLVDGDSTYPAKHAQAMVDMVLARKADMVIGDRLSSTYYTENKRPFHNFENMMVKSMINRLFRSSVSDIMTGYRAFSYDFVKTFPVLAKGFEVETEMTIHALDKGLLIKELPIDYKDRPKGSDSKLNTYRDGYRVIRLIFTLYKEYRPMAFMGWLSLALLLVSVTMIIPVLVDYLRTGLVPRFPTLIASGIFLLGAMQCFFSGLILDVVAKKSRQQFELELNKLSMIRKTKVN